VAWADAAPTVWRREAFGFAGDDDALADAAPSRAVAAADVDRDGDLDLALGGDGLTIWINDGGGRFAAQQPPIEGDAAGDVTALGFGDLDGDGAVDLVVGRGAATAVPSRVLMNNGDGLLVAVPAALAEVPLQARALDLGDLNGDGALDLLLAAEGAPVRLYANRGDGRLEDRSFLSLPSVEAVSPLSAAVADWDGDCLVDAVVGLGEGAAPLSWRGRTDGAMVDDGALGAAGEVILADVDDDGDRDALVLEGEELVWIAR
jgi:hypothetical protein